MSFFNRQQSLATTTAAVGGSSASILHTPEPARENSDSATPPNRSFRFRILQAAGWSMSGYMLSQILRIASNLVLTRLLVPEMFGVMAIATMVLVAVTMFSDLGIRPAAIQSPMGDSQSYLDTAWTVQIIHGCLVWLICIAIGIGIELAARADWFPAGSVYDTPGLMWLVMATGFAMVLTGLQSTKIITAYRRIELGRITQIEVLTQIINLAVAVALAWYTGSIWSFVIATLVSSGFSSALTHIYLKGRRNSLHWDSRAVYDLIRFGRWIILSSIFTVLAANGDRLLLGNWVSPTILGIYVLAFNLIGMFDGVGNRLFMNVAMPALSKISREDPARLKSAFYKFRLPLDLIYVGAAGAVYGGGKLIIDALYDDRYTDATHIIQVLSFSLLISRYVVASNIYLATGEPRYQTFLNLIRTLSIFLVVPMGYFFYGFEGALWGIALHAFPTVPVILFLNARHRLNSPMFEVLILLAWPIGYGAAALTTDIVHLISR